MFLKKVEIQCFRNYTHLCFFPFSHNLIVGDNGHGKTNLLEALVLLAYGRSFRAHLPESFVQEGKTSARISVQTIRENKSSLLQISLDKSGKKQFWINQKRSSGFFVSRDFPLVVFNSEGLVLLKGSAEHRRWWLDHWLSLQGQGLFVQEFKKALVQKNGVLKQVRRKLISGKKAHALLESLNEIFIEKSLSLVKMRRKALRELS